MRGETNAGRPLGSSAGYEALETMTSLTPPVIASRNGRRPRCSATLRRADRHGPLVGRAGSLPEPGEVLHGGGDAALLEPGDERCRELADEQRVRREGAVAEEARARARCVGHRREVDADSRRAERPCRRLRLCPCLRGRVDVRRRRAAAPPRSGAARGRPPGRSRRAAETPATQAACWSCAVTAATSARERQRPIRITPPRCPARTRARNAAVGGARSAPITTAPARRAGGGPPPLAPAAVCVVAATTASASTATTLRITGRVCRSFDAAVQLDGSPPAIIWPYETRRRGGARPRRARAGRRRGPGRSSSPRSVSHPAPAGGSRSRASSISR